jgi:hypothetical protein
MPSKQSPQAWISTRTLLVCALLFSVIAIGLSEVQRRSLVYRIESLISRQEETRKSEAASLETNLVDQGKRLADLQLSIDALQLLIKDGHFASRQEIQTAIGKRLIGGKTIVFRFDENDRETRDAAGAILCGPEAESGYLGVFIAGEQYRVSYDYVTHRWTGSGPAQTRSRSKESAGCPHVSATYGPKELGRAVDPTDILVLWGTSFKLDGLDLLLGGRRVGRVVWVN